MEKIETSPIIYKKWVCVSPVAVFLLVHGLGASSNRWNFLAEFFLKYNIASYAIDLRGFGETKDLKGHVDSFDIYYNDISCLSDIIKTQNSGKKIFLIGDSLGGLIAFLLAGLKPDLFNGMICISAAFKSRLKFGIAEYISIFVSMLFNPRKQFKMPFNSSMCTRDIDYLNAMEIDEEEHRFATPKLILNILLAQKRIKAFQNKIKIPVLFLVAGKLDSLIDPKEVKRIFEGLKTKDKQIIQYQQMYHSLTVDLGRQRVFQDILQWVQKRI